MINDLLCNLVTTNYKNLRAGHELLYTEKNVQIFQISAEI